MAVRPLLVIEDDAAIADIMVSTLAEDGYAVESTTSRHEAVDLLTTQGPDGYCLVMSDAFSGSVSAMFTWLDHVRALTTAPVVIASAHPVTVFAGWEDRGFAGLLPKPFDLDALTALVVALCGPPE